MRLNRVLWILTGSLSLVAAVAGVARPGIYDGLVDPAIMPGVFTQDLVVILGSLLMILLSSSLRPAQHRKAVILFGLSGFIFYAYGIYAMEQVYTMLYPVYLAIFALSFFGLIVGLASVQPGPNSHYDVPIRFRYTAAIFGIFIAIVFNIVWFARLIPLLQTGNRIENTFSIFIIDLCFIMPAFVITAVMAIRRQLLGLVGLPALFVLGVGILSPLALAELVKPGRYGMPMDAGPLAMFAVLSVAFLIFAAVYLPRFRREETA
jgi:hypothetical protein